MVPRGRIAPHVSASNSEFQLPRSSGSALLFARPSWPSAAPALPYLAALAHADSNPEPLVHPCAAKPSQRPADIF